MTAALLVGAVLLLIVLLVAFFSWRRRGREPFTHYTPATPLAREAAGALCAELHQTAALGRDAEALADRLMNTSRSPVGLHPGLVAALERAERSLSAPPTYANYLAVYHGLAGTDASLLAAADLFTAAGQHHARGNPGAPNPEEAALGACLLAMGRQVRRVTASVHRLGAALDLE